MPVTEKQLAANRANAAKSTGPQHRFHSSTDAPEGKARSALSSRSHGFTASTFAVCRIEEFDRLKALRPDLPNEPILEAQHAENEPLMSSPRNPIHPTNRTRRLRLCRAGGRGGAAPCAAQSALAIEDR
jgi:hypothetical protein